MIQTGKITQSFNIDGKFYFASLIGGDICKKYENYDLDFAVFELLPHQEIGQKIFGLDYKEIEKISTYSVSFETFEKCLKKFLDTNQ